MMPKCFTEYRKMVAEAMKAAGAPEMVTELVADLDFEGGPGFVMLWQTWQNIEYYGLENTDADEMALFTKDAVIETLECCRSKMEFAPGEAPRIDPSQFASIAERVAVALEAALNKEESL